MGRKRRERRRNSRYNTNEENLKGRNSKEEKVKTLRINDEHRAMSYGPTMSQALKEI